MEKEIKTTKHKRSITGIVISNKMNKTIVVEVANDKFHSKYKKRYSQTSKFKAHDEREVAQIGDLVRIEECRPMSKEKRWRLSEVLRVAAVKDIDIVEEELAELAIGEKNDVKNSIETEVHTKETK